MKHTIFPSIPDSTVQPIPVANVVAVISQFVDAMAAQDIQVDPADIIADGKIHRIRVGDDRGKNGWYKLVCDDRPAGMFGCNKRYGNDVKFTWKSSEKAKPMTGEERRALRERMQEKARQREEEDRIRHAKAAELANVVFDGAREVTGAEHPYLARKGVQSHGLRVGAWEKLNPNTGELSLIEKDALLVPIRDERKAIHSLQAIFPDSDNRLQRDKDYLTDGDKRGRFYVIGKPLTVNDKMVVLICEGYATGASLHEATDHAVIVAFDAPNLMPVAQVVRDRFPAATIVMCADNDQWTLTPINNPGVTRATEAAKAVGGRVAFPPFTDADGTTDENGKRKGPTDFNDMAVLHGWDAVRGTIETALEATEVVTPPDVDAAWASGKVKKVAQAPADDALVGLLTDEPDDVLPGMMIAQSTPMLPAAVGADRLPAARPKDPLNFVPFAPIAMGQSGDLYAFWTHARKVELIRASDLFKDAGILRLQDLTYWQNYCMASGVAKNGKDKYDRTMVGNMLMQQCSRVGPLVAHAVPESVAKATDVDLQINLAMMHIKPSAYSIAKVLQAHPDWHNVVWANMFAQRIETRVTPPCGGDAGIWSDEHDMLLSAWLSAQYGLNASDKMVRDAVRLLASADKRHPVRDYLNGLQWDGVTRLDTWLSTYAGCEDYTYIRNVGAKTLVGAVARIMKPGVKFDTALVLEGDQGLKKSTLINALSPNDAWYTDNLHGDLGSKDAAIGLQGKWLIEVPEMASMNRTQVDTAKLFMSRKVDDYRSPFDKRNADHPRQCAFFGTINPEADGRYLKDATGGRRFWPVECRNTDIEGLKAVRDQLWAEAAARYAAGEQWWLTDDVEALAKIEQAARQDTNLWTDHVEKYLTYVSPTERGTPDWGGVRDGSSICEEVTTGEIFEAIMGKPITKKDTPDSKLIAQALKAAGWTQKIGTRGKGRHWIRE
ncbi:putative P-loop ATPase/phage/plasmid primase-like uncharacterized protein [Paraburkholderia sp. Clong3]|uniref:VapE domain-containing protein n=1 Tax=Paraburkholderia sp. Clong3 TaxID=2991061 RepID=UPI003D192E03